MGFSLKKIASKITNPINNPIDKAIDTKIIQPIGQAIGGKSATDRLQGAGQGIVAGGMSGGLYGAVAGGIVGGAVGKTGLSKASSNITGNAKTPTVGKTTIAQTTGATGGVSAPNVVSQAEKNAGLALAIQKQQQAVAQRKAPTMAPVLINRKSVRDIAAPDDVANGQSIAMDVSGVQRAVSNDAQQAQAIQMDTTLQGQQRNQQIALQQQLADQASGVAPSVAELQAKKQGDRALAQQLALQAGKSSPLAMRTAAQQQAGIGAEIANQSAILRLQEQQQAQQALGENLSSVRSQDINVAGQQAQLAQQTNLANLQANIADQDRQLRADLANQGVDLDKAKMDAANGNAMALANLQTATANADRYLKTAMANQGVDLEIVKQNAINGNASAMANLQASLQKIGYDDAMQRAYMQNQLDLNAQQAGYIIDNAKIASNENLTQAQLDQQRAIANQQAKTGQMGGLMSAAGALGAAYIAKSDKNAKKDIKDGNKSIGEFLKNLNSYDYNYKDEKWGKGQQNSIMAQDLEKSIIGKKAVIDTPEGKLVDYSKLLPAMLSGLSMQQKKIMSLEQALKLKKGGK